MVVFGTLTLFGFFSESAERKISQERVIRLGITENENGIMPQAEFLHRQSPLTVQH